jgi:hypothetical protein
MITENSKLAKILSNIKSKDGEKNLFQHLNKMYEIKKLINDDIKFNDLFEDISLRIKEQGKYILKEKNKENLDPKIYENERKLLTSVSKGEGEGEAAGPTSVSFIPDYIDVFNKLSFSGVGLSTKELLLINNSLKNLALTLPNGNVTFFGKIFCSEKDYYVAEATEVDPPADAKYEADMEKRKEDGINRNTFYVTNNLYDKWVDLPDVSPRQLKQSQIIRYIFTGNLNRKIYTNPTFDGEERHLLRCQLARIYHGAKLVPSINHYIVEDKENVFKQLTPNQEKVKRFTNETLTSTLYWIHYPPKILKCCRVSHPEPPAEGDPEQYKIKMNSIDPYGDRISPCENDKYIVTNFQGSKDYYKIMPWKIEQFYEDNIYINPYINEKPEEGAEPKENKYNYSVVTVKSLRWPGAINAYVNGETYFFYFGNGMKTEDNNNTDFSYQKFPKIPDDIPDKVDQEEPHDDSNNPNPAENKEEKKEEEKNEG